jgi:hypothetical protein
VGRQFDFIDCRLCWNEWRVFYYAADMELAYFPASWTDVSGADPFVLLSEGRAMARVDDLLRLADLVKDIRRATVNEITPNV